MTEYVNLYNDCMGDFLDIFSKKYNLENENLREKYHYEHTKKLTGYMLFVQDMYQNKSINSENKFTNNSKIISQKWKTLDKNLKKQYNDTAMSRNTKTKKVVIEIIEIIEEEKKDEKIIYNDELDCTDLTEIEKDGKKYIIDNYNNIINIDDTSGNYIGYVGYIKDDEIFLY